MDKETYFSDRFPVKGYGKLSNWSRVAVEDSNPGLWEGRCFKSLYQGALGNNASVWVRFKPDCDVHILGQSMSVNNGGLKAEMYAGCTEGGAWIPGITFGANGSNRLRRQPYYVSQTTVANGGTCTGGILVDRVDCVAGTGSSSSTATSEFSGESITGPGTYHVKFTNLSAGNITFLYRSWWEEVPEVTGWESFPV